MRELSGKMDIFYILIRVMITWVHTFVNNHRPAQVKDVNFTLCKLYNKVDFLKLCDIAKLFLKRNS